MEVHSVKLYEHLFDSMPYIASQKVSPAGWHDRDMTGFVEHVTGEADGLNEQLTFADIDVLEMTVCSFDY